MPRTYYQLLQYAFKRFSILSARRTLVPTLKYYLTRMPLPLIPSQRDGWEKPALFTMNILPPMATVWYHFAEKNLGNHVDKVMFDCSGTLNPKDFPNMHIQKFLNFYAAKKSDEFLYHIATNRKIGWICDDDMFPMSPQMINILQKEFAEQRTASVSFRPRNWWHYEINGQSYEVSSSYCTAINRRIFCDTEHLSLKPADDNNHPSHIGKPPMRYDTFDKANEILIQKGYRCAIVPESERDICLTGFSGMSGAVILLHEFKKPEDTILYYMTPPKEQWRGNVLFGTLSSMLAICTICELYEMITGKKYVLPSLPTREQLLCIRETHLPYVRDDQDPAWFDAVGERLKREL